MDDIAIPVVAFFVLFIAFGVFMVIRPDSINRCVERFGNYFYGERLTKHLMIRGSRATGILMVALAVGLLGVFLFAVLPAK